MDQPKNVLTFIKVLEAHSYHVTLMYCSTSTNTAPWTATCRRHGRTSVHGATGVTAVATLSDLYTRLQGEREWNCPCHRSPAQLGAADPGQ